MDQVRFPLQAQKNPLSPTNVFILAVSYSHTAYNVVRSHPPVPKESAYVVCKTAEPGHYIVTDWSCTALSVTGTGRSTCKKQGSQELTQKEGSLSLCQRHAKKQGFILFSGFYLPRGTTDKMSWAKMSFLKAT